MKYLLLSLLLALGALPVWAQTAKPASNPKLDTALARKLGANEHGLKKYVFCLLKEGTNKDTAKAPRRAAFQGHMNNIHKLADEGKLLLAGPYLDDSNWAGLFIFNVEKVAEADALVNSDPAVRAGYLTYELHPWMGSAAVMLIPEMHKTVAKQL